MLDPFYHEIGILGFWIRKRTLERAHTTLCKSKFPVINEVYGCMGAGGKQIAPRTHVLPL
jgi:hypothetical protein